MWGPMYGGFWQPYGMFIFPFFFLIIFVIIFLAARNIFSCFRSDDARARETELIMAEEIGRIKQEIDRLKKNSNWSDENGMLR